MKVKQVEIAKEVIKSDGWWRFACGDVLEITRAPAKNICEGQLISIVICFIFFLCLWLTIEPFCCCIESKLKIQSFSFWTKNVINWFYKSSRWFNFNCCYFSDAFIWPLLTFIFFVIYHNDNVGVKAPSIEHWLTTAKNFKALSFYQRISSIDFTKAIFRRVIEYAQRLD